MKELSESLRAFIQTQELMRLAYISGDYPRVVPVWFVIIDGDYVFGTYRSMAKWKAIQKNPRIGWVIDGGPMDGYKGASFYGRAEEITDRDECVRIYRALGEKYFGAPDHPKFIEIYGPQDNEDTAYLRLKVEDGFTWEY
jgi:nitroimidazol reductase NimA-like FMN-containing flavoprotein (pyridoxamine 5'-phosphate oxidase superfamily)